MKNEKMKKVFKSVASVLLLTALIGISTSFIEALYDHRVILGVIAGAFGYDLIYKALGKLKGLQ